MTSNDWLLVSDIHLHDYPRYNKTPKARLNQSIKLAHRIAEVGRERGIKTLVLAGDFIEVPTNRSYIVHKLKEFFEILSEGFDTVFYILGQHELDSKSQGQEFHDSIVTVIAPKNFQYMDKKFFQHQGKNIAFMNWKPTQDLTWIKDPVDLFIGHVTVDARFGQPIDNTKFKLGIVGDIHQAKTVGNLMCIGTPQQNKLGDQQNSTAVVWNPESNTAQHIDLDPDHSRFLRFQYTQNPDQEGWDGDLLYKIYKPLNLTKKEENGIEVPEWSNIEDLINKIVDGNGLTEIHQKVLLSNPETEEVDFDFQVTNLKITGFRSIKSLDIDFTSDEVSLIVGPNGSGKSTILLALYKALAGDRHLADHKHVDCDVLELEVSLFYQGIQYTIIRGNANNSLFIDGAKQPFNNKKQFTDKVIELLPFLRYLEVMYLNPENASLGSKLSSDRIIELITKFYRFNKLNGYNYQAQQMVNEMTIELNKDIGLLRDSQTKLDYVTEKLEGLTPPSRSEVEIKNELEELKNLQLIKDQLAKIQSGIQAHETNQTFYSDKLNELHPKIVEITNKGVQYESEISTLRNQYQSELDGGNDNRTLLTETKNTLSEIKLIRTQKDSLDSKISTLKANECYTCGHALEEDKVEKMKSDLQTDSDKLDSQIKEKLATVEGVDLALLQQSIDSNQSILTEINNQINSLVSEQTDLNNLNSQYSDFYEQYNSVLASIKSLNEELATYSTAEIPEDLSVRIIEVSTELTKGEQYIELSNDKKKVELELGVNQSNVDNKKSEIDLFNNYIRLTSRTGQIVEELLTGLLEKFTDEDFIYECQSGVYRNKKFLRVARKYRVTGGMTLNYQSLSSGQKVLCDLDFINKLITKSGLLIMDEYFKFLDDDNLSLGTDMIREFNVNTLLVCTHSLNYSHYTRKLLAKLNKQNNESEFSKVE